MCVDVVVNGLGGWGFFVLRSRPKVSERSFFTSQGKMTEIKATHTKPPHCEDAAIGQLLNLMRSRGDRGSPRMRKGERRDAVGDLFGECGCPAVNKFAMKKNVCAIMWSSESCWKKGQLFWCEADIAYVRAVLRSTADVENAARVLYRGDSFNALHHDETLDR